jgi:hypothetical protein
MWPNNSHQTSAAYSGYSSASPPPLSDLNRWFDYYDRDHSGFLTKDEVTKAVIETFGVKSIPSFVVKQAVNSVWKNFDRNKDGRIDKHEFTKVGGVGSKLLSVLPLKQGTHGSIPTQQQQQHGMSYSMPPQYNAQQQNGLSYSMPPQYATPPVMSSYPYQSAPHDVPVATAVPVVSQPPQYQTIRATIPPGMSAGQSLNINTPSGMYTVVIPDQSQWTNSHTGQFSFECRIPCSAPVVHAQRW